jgi:hypothetical protein
MPDAMMNGGFAPYLAQAFTPQGVQGGLFGNGVGNVPGNIFGTPTFGQSYGMTGGGIPSFSGMPTIGQQFQPSIGWQQQLPQFSQLSPFGQITGQGSAGLGSPYAQVQPWGQVQPGQNIG